MAEALKYLINTYRSSGMTKSVISATLVPNSKTKTVRVHSETLKVRVSFTLLGELNWVQEHVAEAVKYLITTYR